MKVFKFILGMVGAVVLWVVGGGLAGNAAIAEEVSVGEVPAEEVTHETPEVYIRAVNPGYTVDGKSNVGEMIELARGGKSDASISLTGITISYTNSSGNRSTLIEFPENSYLTGETLLLRLASSPESELAAVVYTKTLAFKAGIELMRGEEVVDAVCWTGKDGCYKEFKSASPTVLVRNLETLEFEHVAEYEPKYDANSYLVKDEKKDEEGYGLPVSQCKGLQFAEILTYYETLKSEQFIELYNSGSEQVLLDGCSVRYKNKSHILKGVVKPEEYFVYYPDGFSLTRNPTNGNTIELFDVNGDKIDSLWYPNGQRKGTSYAMIGYDTNGEELWRVTYAPTPGAPNNYQEYKTCEEGKVLNEATGNCVKATKVSAKICAEGYYLNVLTGRCKKNETVTEKQCKEGYYLNEETGRCRKIKENTGAEYEIVPEEYKEEKSFVALYAVLGVLAVGMVYLVYEFRHEIVKLWHRVFR